MVVTTRHSVYPTAAVHVVDAEYAQPGTEVTVVARGPALLRKQLKGAPMPAPRAVPISSWSGRGSRDSPPHCTQQSSGCAW